MRHLDIAFIGWQGAADDPRLDDLGRIAARHGAMAVVTLGTRGILVFDPLGATRFFGVEPVPVQGSTNGCGDAFIAYFLAEYWRHHDLDRAIAHGKLGGALATQWRFALPDEAYGR